MSRAEEAALKAYPEILEWDGGNQYTGAYGDTNKYPRKKYQEGYEQAEKDTIERAIKWLKANADSYIVDMQVSRMLPPEPHIGGMCWDEFKKAMEEEK